MDRSACQKWSKVLYLTVQNHQQDIKKVRKVKESRAEEIKRKKGNGGKGRMGGKEKEKQN